MIEPSNPRTASRGAVAVFEQRPWWAPELQRQFGDAPVTVRGCRSAADALHADVAVLQFDPAPADVLPALGRIAASGVDRGVIIVASPEWLDLEWTLRELGVDAIVDEQIGGADLAALLRAWGATPSPCDLTLDGRVDGADLGRLLAGWTRK